MSPSTPLSRRWFMQDEAAKPLIVLMHGDRKGVDEGTGATDRLQEVEPCAPEVANRHTGFPGRWHESVPDEKGSCRMSSSEAFSSCADLHQRRAGFLSAFHRMTSCRCSRRTVCRLANLRAKLDFLQSDLSRQFLPVPKSTDCMRTNQRLSRPRPA